MTIAYTWTISAVDVAPAEDGLINVIKVAHWRLRATDDTDGLTTEVYGAQGFAAPEPASYTPYDEVTKADVISWIEGAMGEDNVTAMKAGLDAAIAEIRNPKIISDPPPWASVPEPVVEPEPESEA